MSKTSLLKQLNKCETIYNSRGEPDGIAIPETLREALVKRLDKKEPRKSKKEKK